MSYVMLSAIATSRCYESTSAGFICVITSTSMKSYFYLHTFKREVMSIGAGVSEY
ncbi:MAG TPA: hypothetical protein IGS40_10585 [Trichormus sp. M33_DOE_039]|nr:hypothetical protein [Trichormus sp. M33_DOE_039]